MKMNFSVGVGGMLRKIAALKGKLTKDALEEIATAGADVFEQEAKQLCPVETGELRDSIQKLGAEAVGPLLVVVRMGPTAPYAARIEFGYKGPDSKGRHYHQGPHSYMRAAYDTKQDEARAAMVGKGREILDEALHG